MGLNAILTPDDLKKGELAEVAWHPMEFVSYEEKEAKTDSSTNVILGFKIIDGPSKGIIVQKLFNEKALGFGKALWKVFGFPVDGETGMRISDEMIKSKLNSKLKGYVKRGKSNQGNEFNDLVDFMPLA